MKREPASNFQDLLVWQKAHQFVLDVYEITNSFPKSEMYGLTSQLRRTAVSIAANIAEGFKKKGKRDIASFYNISQGSLEECHYYLILSDDLEYADTDQLKENLVEISKMLESYRKTILSSKS